MVSLREIFQTFVTKLQSFRQKEDEVAVLELVMGSTDCKSVNPLFHYVCNPNELLDPV